MHDWSYAYTEPDVRPPLSMDSPIREISDDPEVWTAVTEKLTHLIPRNVFVVNMLKSQSKRSLRDALAGLPNAEVVLSAMSTLLAELEQKSLTDA